MSETRSKRSPKTPKTGKDSTETEPVHSTTVVSSKMDSSDSSESKSNNVSRSGNVVRREVLIRQPSYCKILNDLRDTEATIKNEALVMTDVSSDSESVQTITINGQQYQIVSPSALQQAVGGPEGLQTLASVSQQHAAANVIQYAATTQNGQTVFVPASANNSPNEANGSGSVSKVEDAARKREVRLMKNREAARECRNKKKEYIKCLENRVAVLENQNKALIEELKSLKELYTGQNNGSSKRE